MTSIGWFYVADSLIGGVLLVNFVLPSLSIRGLSAQRRLPSSHRSAGIFEDDSLTVSIELRSKSVMPKSFLVVSDDCPVAGPEEGRQNFLIGTIAPRGRVEASYDVRCYKRGIYSFGRLRMETSAPFGLFRARRTLKAPLEVTVYPNVLPIGATSTHGALQGLHPMQSPPGLSGEFRGSREYQRDDYVRNIHWRTTARRGELMVSEFDQTPQGEVRLGFNPAIDLGEGRDTTLEYAIKIAAGLADRCRRDGRPFRMWPRPAASEALPSWHETLEHLARLRPDPHPSIEEFLGHRTAPGVSVLVISAADKESVGLVARGRALGGAGAVVLLEGFDAAEDPGAAAALARTGVPVVRCERGRLHEGLDAMGRTISSTGSRRVRRPDRVESPT